MERGQEDHLLLGSEEGMSPLIHLYAPDQTWAQLGQLVSIQVQAAPLLHILDLLGAEDSQGWWFQQGPAHDPGWPCSVKQLWKTAEQCETSLLLRSSGQMWESFN